MSSVGVFGPYAGGEKGGHALAELLEEGDAIVFGEGAGRLVGEQRFDGAVAQFVAGHDQGLVAVGVEADDEVAERAKVGLVGVVAE